ncbi:MAG: single-stranded-DNA-specific exonuclease RecJ [Bacteroidia bacterium]|nr:MAG: single-stranded-DNA-specific exonuclease RecJ [Bacteroidia bacterium]
MQRKIIIKDPPEEKALQQLIAESKSKNPIIASLLLQRGINSYEEAKSFFRPSPDHLHNPFLMQDMDKAVARLSLALKNKENILVYGDYDVDGTSSVALVYSFLKNEYCAKVDYYIPDRYTEGYGISFDGIDYAARNKQTLVIALDCGIKAVEKMEYASEKKIDFIICDHHTPGEYLPKALAVLDPKRNDCNYPDKNLSGCGVGFKLLQALCERENTAFDSLLQYLDFVAISIASDIVPIIGENRILAYHGLKKLNENPTPGLSGLLQLQSIKGKKMNISDCVFKIGPRINAAGRIKSGKYAVELLVSKNTEIANDFALQIDQYNTQRRSIEQGITEEALQMIAQNEQSNSQRSTVLYNEKWHKGIIGIVASRLIETHYKPTIILTKSDEYITGSARSVVGFDLYSAIENSAHLLKNFGGHKYAAGLTLHPENLEQFRQEFESYVTEHITPEQMRPVLTVDAELNLGDIDAKFYNALRQMAPFGPANMTPVFLTKHLRDTGRSQKVGKDQTHLKLEVTDEDNNIFEGIAFSAAPAYYDLIHVQKKRFSLCYTIDLNEFKGTKKLQLLVKEIYVEN